MSSHISWGLLFRCIFMKLSMAELSILKTNQNHLYPGFAHYSSHISLVKINIFILKEMILLRFISLYEVSVAMLCHLLIIQLTSKYVKVTNSELLISLEAQQQRTLNLINSLNTKIFFKGSSQWMPFQIMLRLFN